MQLQIPSPLQALDLPLFRENQIKFYVKRDDLIHPLLSGNKWRKLKYNLLQARQQGKSTLLSFGGAYSNHIHALAAAGYFLNFKTIGVIRGERAENLSSTLDFAEQHGMQLHFIDRQQYREKQGADFLAGLYAQFGDVYILPEGGSNSLALVGCAEIITELDQQMKTGDYTLASAVGSGGTVAGLLSKVQQQKILGVAVLKGAGFLQNDVQRLLGEKPRNFSLLLDHHFGGYAKTDNKLLAFMEKFQQDSGINIEPVYTAKLFYGLFELIKKGHFKPGTRLVALHTGGLQGYQ